MSPFVRSLSGVAVLLILIEFHWCAGDYRWKTKRTEKAVSLILTPALARQRGSGDKNSDFEGFLPEFLAALHERQGLPNYKILVAKNNELGTEINGNYTGMLFDLIPDSFSYGAGPILKPVDDIKHVAPYINHVTTSRPWATVHLTLVVRKDSNVTSLREALNRIMNIRVINGSAEQELIDIQSRKQDAADLYRLRNRIGESPTTYTLNEGLRAVAHERNTALVLNTEDATYHVTHEYDCALTAVPHFVELGKYVFALEQSSEFTDSLNSAIEGMKSNGSLESLHRKWVGVVGQCSRAVSSSQSHEGLVIFLALMFFKFSAFLHSKN